MTERASTAITAREADLLVRLLETKVENARLISLKWLNTTEDQYDGDAEGLTHERGFADGVHHGLGEALQIMRQVTADSGSPGADR